MQFQVSGGFQDVGKAAYVLRLAFEGIADVNIVRSGDSAVMTLTAADLPDNETMLALLRTEEAKTQQMPAEARTQ